MKKSRQERLEEQNTLLSLREEVEKELRKIPGVVSVGVGLKEVKETLTEEICFRVYVKEKKTEKDIDPKHVIPKTIRGIRTDVIVIGEDELIGEDEDKYRPLQGGIQIGNEKGAHVGTFGCIATINSGPNAGKTVLLSNHHVLYADGATKEDKVGQPSHSKCICCACNEIGIVEDGETNATLDCAIAIINTNDGFTNEIKEIGWIAGTNVAVVGDIVRKRGRTTLLTEGTVKEIAYANGKTGQIRIEPNPPHPKFVDSGDSGSVVVNEDNEVVGLIWAKTGIDGVANHIAAVQARLNITVARTGTAGSIPLSSTRENVVEEKAPLSLILQKIENELKEVPEGEKILELIYQHQQEVRDLINNNREVKVAWHRYEGPAFMTHFINSAQDPEYAIPKEIKGVSLQNLLIRMSVVLEKHGSEELIKAVNEHSLMIFNYAHECVNLRALLDKIKYGAQKEVYSEPLIGTLD